MGGMCRRGNAEGAVSQSIRVQEARQLGIL